VNASLKPLFRNTFLAWLVISLCSTDAAAVSGAVPIPQPRPGSEEKTEPEEKKPAPEEKQSAPAKPDEPAPQDKKPSEKTDERIYQNACPALMHGEVQGKMVPPLSDGMCGERSPLSLTSIGKENPLVFAAPVTTNCAMASTLAKWASGVRAAALKSFNAEIESVGTGADYQCRKVNSGTAGRASEHAFANALDIMSFRFKNGRTTELASGWNGKPEEKDFWRAVHKTSCEMFMTVIGPDGDAAHRTNLHLDLGCHGKDCTARICQ
jgi:hypothetical protein